MEARWGVSKTEHMHQHYVASVLRKKKRNNLYIDLTTSEGRYSSCNIFFCDTKQMVKLKTSHSRAHLSFSLSLRARARAR
jgi:hypothetical protein